MSGSRTSILKIVGLMLLVSLALWLVLQLPADVPDANSPLEGNHTGEVNGGNTVGQTFVANRDGLSRIDLVVAVERPIAERQVTFRIRELPWQQEREVKRGLADLPAGKVADLRPGTITERWYSFEFDPVGDSAGKQFFFSLESPDLPGPNSVGLMMYFHNEYPFGEAYINGSPANAHVAFKAYTRGRLQDLVGAVAENLMGDKPGLAGAPATYLALVLLYLFSAGVVIVLVRRTA